MRELNKDEKSVHWKNDVPGIVEYIIKVLDNLEYEYHQFDERYSTRAEAGLFVSSTFKHHDAEGTFREHAFMRKSEFDNPRPNFHEVEKEKAKLKYKIVHDALICYMWGKQ